MRFAIALLIGLLAGKMYAADLVPPFEPLNSEQQTQLDTLLSVWEKQSQATKTFECDFESWHYDSFKAPAGVHASKESGRIGYAAPDKGLFRVTERDFYQGMKLGKLIYAPRLVHSGDHWILNGARVIDVDHDDKKITVTEASSVESAVQAAKEFLPMIFQINAEEIREKYWVREIKSPQEGMRLLEAWPKTTQDQSRYKLLQIALSEGTFDPQALIMYAPNFDAKTAPSRTHYEFKNIRRNTANQKLPEFMNNFLCVSRLDWEVVHEVLPAKH